MGKEKQPVWVLVLLIVGMLATGTLNTLTTKIQFTLTSVGEDGTTKVFAKPWFGSWNMLFAMFLVGIVDGGVRAIVGTGRPPMASDGDQKSLLGAPLVAEPGISYARKVQLVAVPALFDLLATALGCIGILFIPASAWQMLRGACIIFAAMFAVLWLKREMWAFNWLGLALCVTGVVMVGVANMLGGSVHTSGSSSSEVAFGMTMVLLAQVVQAAQVIAEEWLMKDVNLPMLQIVGWEGFWGCAMMLVVGFPLLYLLPGDDEGSLENTYDTLVMIRNSPGVLQCVVVYVFSCSTFNATGIAVTGALSAVHRMMLDASRTTIIWAFGLWVHYYHDEHSAFGEVWTQYSKIQLLGFLVLVTGQAIYGEVLRVPGLKAPPQASPIDARGMQSPASITSFSSPLPRAPPQALDHLTSPKPA